MYALMAPSFLPLFLFTTGLHARTTRVLLFLVIPGNLIFLYTIRVLQAGHTTLTLIFTSAYLLAGLIQVHLCSLYYFFRFSLVAVIVSERSLPFLKLTLDTL